MYEHVIYSHIMRTRITITIPEELVREADAKAEQLGRSRSWVLAEALRGYLRGAPSRVVRETATRPYRSNRWGQAGPIPVDAAPEVAESRRRRLRAELALAPLERLQRAEEIAQLGEIAPRPRIGAQIVAFDSYEDYYEWKRNRLIRV
jgi:hypothetical protein